MILIFSLFSFTSGEYFCTSHRMHSRMKKTSSQQRNKGLLYIKSPCIAAAICQVILPIDSSDMLYIYDCKMYCHISAISFIHSGMWCITNWDILLLHESHWKFKYVFRQKNRCLSNNILHRVWSSEKHK